MRVDGETCARIFEHFKRGRTDLRNIVIEERVPPALVRELYREYANSDLKEMIEDEKLELAAHREHKEMVRERREEENFSRTISRNRRIRRNDEI